MDLSNMSLYEYFLMFIIYAFVGWAIEVVNNIVKNKNFVNRGFLIGPYCPIYGFGGIAITIFLTRFYSNPLLLFIMALVICSILEYFTSYFMEKLFKARWWDYSHLKYNINGRICLDTMIPFGILGCFVIYFSNPLLFKLFDSMNSNVLNIISITTFIIFLIDNFISFGIITNLEKSASNLIKKDSTEEITKMVKEALKGKSIFHRRLLNAFPNFKAEFDRLMRSYNKKH